MNRMRRLTRMSTILLSLKKFWGRCQRNLRNHEVRYYTNASERQTSTIHSKSTKIGHDAEDIEKFERMGFVMSGNRRKKKPSTKSAEKSSRKASLMQAREEKELRESELVSRFKAMIEGHKENAGNS